MTIPIQQGDLGSAISAGFGLRGRTPLVLDPVVLPVTVVRDVTSPALSTVPRLVGCHTKITTVAGSYPALWILSAPGWITVIRRVDMRSSVATDWHAELDRQGAGNMVSNTDSAVLNAYMPPSTIGQTMPGATIFSAVAAGGAQDPGFQKVWQGNIAAATWMSDVLPGPIVLYPRDPVAAPNSQPCDVCTINLTTDASTMYVNVLVEEWPV